MTTRTIIITALPSNRGGLESSVLAVKRPASNYSAVMSPSPVYFSPSMNVQQNENYEYDDDYDDDQLDISGPPRKRERLTHLSPEEKLFRRYTFKFLLCT